MRSDDKNSGVGKGAEINAQELLELLNKSLSEKPVSDGKTVAKTQKRTGALKIDDDVYKAAESELHNSDAITAKDDSDLDIDALIEKFINEPKKQREREAAESFEEPEVAEPEIVVNELEVPRAEEAMEVVESSENETVSEVTEVITEATVGDAEDVAETPVAAVTSDIDGEVLDSKEDEEEQLPRSAVQLTVFDELEEIAAIDSNVSDDVTVYEGDDDVKVAAPARTASEVPVDVENEVISYDVSDDTEKTAVFDISKVRQLAEDSEEDTVASDAFNMGETEVFTPVHEEDLADINTESPIPETVYGQDATGEIDQTDLNLMIAFGMNEELKDTVGEEQAVAMEDDIVREHEETVQMQAVEEQCEFTSRDQIKDILTKYKSNYYTLIIRIAAAAAILGLLFVFENHSLLGLTMPAFIRPSSYPVVFAMIDLQLVVLCGVLVWRQVYDGVKNIIALKPTPESLTAFVLALSVIYTFIAAFTAPVSGFALYNLPTVFAVLLALIYEFMNLKRDVFSFNIISSKRRKFVVTPVSDTTESLEREIFNDYLPAGSQIVRVGKTDFVDGFFKRVNEKNIAKPIIGIAAPAVLLVSLAFLIITAIRGGTVYESLTAAFMTSAFIMPVTAFVIYSYPFYKASKDAYDVDSAIIGEVSLGEYSGSSVISFEDKEVFPSGGVKVTSIKVYGNNRIDEIIYSLASAFMKVGGPLADVFSQATHDLGHSDDVELLEVDDDGFTVTIDDVPVYIGKATYMEKKNYEPPFDSDGRQRDQSASVGILYIAYSGQLAAKVYVQYTIDAEFEAILSQLYKTGMCVGIKSFDPNIDDLLLAKKIKAMKYPVKVIRSRTVEDIPQVFDRCDSGIVSKRSVKSLLKTVALCERVSGVVKTSLIVKILAMFIGVVVMAFIMAFGAGGAVPSLYVMLYQLFFIIPVWVMARFMV